MSSSIDHPTICIIGGSGIGKLLSDAHRGQKHSVGTPFGSPSDQIIESELHGIRLLLLGRHGWGHSIPPSQIPFRANIFALKKLGCTHILATGAVGSLRQEVKPRDLVVPDQIIDRTYRRIGTFYDGAAVHVEFAEPFCPVLRQILLEEKIHARGCYVCVEGPMFSTRAESLMHRLWGGDIVGMTAMPEARLAREAEIPYALLALATDYDSWRAREQNQDEMSLLAEITNNLQSAGQQSMELLGRAIARIASDPQKLSECPARSALTLAIWTDKSKINKDEIERLRPLWGKYIE